MPSVTGFPALAGLSALWLLIVVWLIGRAFRQSRIIARLHPAPAAERQDSPGVAIVVPARDERANIRRCVESLLSQDYRNGRFQVVVVDDQSRDGTSDIVASIAQDDHRLSLHCAPRLPAHWTGKCHACALGASRADKECRWLCFMDADVQAAASLLAAAVATAERDNLDLLSLAPRHELGSFAERLMIPCGHYVLAFCQDLSRAQSPERDGAVATGQFMLIRQAAYRAIGGHGAVRSAICEDLKLALLAKRRGYRVRLMDGGGLLSTRMYDGWRSLWPGFAKNITEMLGGPAATIAVASAGALLAAAAVLLPAIDFIVCRQGAAGACLAAALALTGSAAAFAFHIAGAIHFRTPFWYGLLFPFGYAIGWLMALDSVRRRFGGGIAWKGRQYQ